MKSLDIFLILEKGQWKKSKGLSKQFLRHRNFLRHQTLNLLFFSKLSHRALESLGPGVKNKYPQFFELPPQTKFDCPLFFSLPPYFFWGYFWRFRWTLNTNLTFRFNADIIDHWCHWCLKSKNFQLEWIKFKCPKIPMPQIFRAAPIGSIMSNSIFKFF